MKRYMRNGWWARGLGVAAVCCAAVLCGCESEDTDKDITSTRFNVERDLVNYSSTDEFTWDTTLTQALVTVRINDFREGDTSLRVYDGRGDLVFAVALNTLNSAYYNGEDLFFQRRTDAGQAGLWRVVFGYDDFTGDLNITME